MVRAIQFIKEALDSDAMNELKLFINNDEDLYRRQFMPIIANIKRKIKRGVQKSNYKISAMDRYQS